MMGFLLVGDRNSGKSTLVYEAASKMNFSCGGIISIPVISGVEKVGTDALDIMTGKAIALARTHGLDGIAVGRYILSTRGLKYGKDAIYRAVGKCKLVVIDEFGPLEMDGEGMTEAAEYAFENSNVLVVMRRKLKDEFIEKYRMYEFKIIDANEVNASGLAKIIQDAL